MHAIARTFTFRRVLLGWAFLCVVGWLVLGPIAEADSAKCRANYGLLCPPEGVGFIIVGVLAALTWLLGAGIITLVRMVVTWNVAVTVQEGSTVTLRGRVYHGGERIVVSKPCAKALRKESAVKWVR